MPRLRNSLAGRMTLWFILLSFLTVGIIVVFVRQTIAGVFVDITARNMFREAGQLARSISEEGSDSRSLQMLVGDHTDEEHLFFVIDADGNYAAHPDPGRVAASMADDYPSGVVEAILGQNEGIVSEDADIEGVMAYTAVSEQTLTVVGIASQSVIDAPIQEIERPSIIQVGAALLIAAVAGGAATWISINPIQRLTRAVQQVGEGNLDTRIEEGEMEDELGVLAANFNLMADQLQSLVEGLEQRVEERTQELQVALERAEEADRIKSQFLASMSHELRTPLNAILTFNELLAMGTFGEVNEEQVDYLKKSLNSGRHLLSLINDVLDITKIQSGMMSLFIEEGFDVAKELADIADSAERMLDGKPVKLVMDINGTFPPLTCDKRRVRQVLLNLIGNAVKFTEEGTITVSAKSQDSQILFAIIDTGPGIPKDQQGIIFEPFVQTKEGVKHAGGTGLGLPISRRLTEAHGGRLWVESVPGEGAAFYAEFPLAQKAGDEHLQ